MFWLRTISTAVSIAVILSVAGPGRAEKATPQQVRVVYLTQLVEKPPVLYTLESDLPDEGIQGGRLAVRDSNTTGRFTGHHYRLVEAVVPADGDLTARFKQLVREGQRIFITDLPAPKLLSLAGLPEAEDVLIFNASARDDALRNDKCRKNVLHTAPSRAMLADAAAQFLVRKNWKRWFLVTGPEEGDRLFSADMRRAAQRFGGKIVEEKQWTFTHDFRRTADKEIPLFTQEVDYEVLLVTDERRRFGDYLTYRTWNPRLVAGSAGLVPTTWHRAHEQWGANQLQSRFLKFAGRRMTDLDYNAWTAVRSVSEAVTRTDATDVPTIRRYVLSAEFELAAFKGVPLSYRDWNGQLRQPILLVTPRSLVSVSPQRGFLHPVTPLDSLGYDRPETTCRLE